MPFGASLAREAEGKLHQLRYLIGAPTAGLKKDASLSPPEKNTLPSSRSVELISESLFTLFRSLHFFVRNRTPSANDPWPYHPQCLFPSS